MSVLRSLIRALICSTQVNNPTTRSTGAGAATSAGADPKFRGGRDAHRSMKEKAGVIEAYPGIIESTNIDPLNENSNKGMWCLPPRLRTCS